jgi:hypothetical protein
MSPAYRRTAREESGCQQAGPALLREWVMAITS